MLRPWDILLMNRFIEFFLYLAFVGIHFGPLIVRRWFVWLLDIAAD